MANHPIKITIENGYYEMRAPYDARLTETLKATINKSLRAWDGDKRAWIISPKAGDLLIKAILRAGYPAPDLPLIDAATAVSATVQKAFTVEYLGTCKERGQGVITALGSIKGYWSIEFPEAVLKAWFDRQTTTDNVQTFYQVLCVFESATDAEIKSAHRRLARQWHPDVCSEENAAEKFRELTDAYEVLREPSKRRRYDAGLFFEREAKKKQDAFTSSPFDSSPYSRRGRRFESQYFRSPLRCGLITAEGVQRLGRFNVSKILAWDDITDAAGRVMSASWNKFTESIEIKWI